MKYMRVCVCCVCILCVNCCLVSLHALCGQLLYQTLCEHAHHEVTTLADLTLAPTPSVPRHRPFSWFYSHLDVVKCFVFSVVHSCYPSLVFFPIPSYISSNLFFSSCVANHLSPLLSCIPDPFCAPQKLPELQVFRGESGEHSDNDQGERCDGFFWGGCNCHTVKFVKLG